MTEMKIIFLLIVTLAGVADAQEFRVAPSTNFDAVMQKMPPKAVIHLAPGIYQTMGGFGWGPKTGQHIIGAGMGLTVLQFTSNAVVSGACFDDRVISVQAPYDQQNIMVEDLTLDCNYQPGTITTLHGINLSGSGNTIRHVQLINAASFTKSATNYFEAWGIIISAVVSFTDASSNLIEDCVVSDYHCNFHNNLTAIGLMENNSGIIKNNSITQDGTNYISGIVPGSHNSTVEGNILNGVTVGSHMDAGNGFTNATFSRNQFINTSCAIDWRNYTFQDCSFDDNQISLTNDGTGYCSTEAFNFGPKPALTHDISIRGNTVRISGTNNFPQQAFIVGYNIHAILIEGNRVDARLGLTLAGSHSGIVAVDNYDLDGKPSPFNTTHTISVTHTNQ
jgi:hypothetical protein